ncbi:MAG: hypothetical protein IJ228_01885 [Succinivibrio sp.]|nr:hypothetical protein [Succinivibrio sp.]
MASYTYSPAATTAIGAIPIPVPYLPEPQTLGPVAGTLIASILLARFGDGITCNLLHWRMHPVVQQGFFNMGIVLFLGILGIIAGAEGFWDCMISGQGLRWMALSALICVPPLLLACILYRMDGSVNFLLLCGVLAGAYTDPPALAYASDMQNRCDGAATGYAAVYPLVMLLRVLSVKLLIIVAVIAA